MYGRGEDLEHPPGLELAAYKRYQSGSLGPDAPSVFVQALKDYDKNLFPCLLNGKWNIFRWGQTSWALKWPRFVATVTDSTGNGYRTPTQSDVQDLAAFGDPYGPRWNGDFARWTKFLDAHEEEEKKDKERALDNKVGAIVDKHLRKVRREFSQFIVPKAYYPDAPYRDGMFNSNTRWGKERAMNKRIYS